jgi:cytochrome c oxidase subunit 2
MGPLTRRTWHPRPAWRYLGFAVAVAVYTGLFSAETAFADFQSPFTPASPNAAQVTNLFWIIIAIAAVIFVGVEGALIYASIAYRRDRNPRPAQFASHPRLEIAWTAAPTIILLIVFILTWRTLKDIRPPEGDPVDIQATAHQWWWEFNYSNGGPMTANELHVPVGETVFVHLTSTDVIHSFWPPSLSPKYDAIPGQARIVWFQAQQPGIYVGNCAEFCGIEHSWMFFRVYALSAADYQTWLRSQQQAPAPATGSLAAQGQTIYQSQTCSNCHAIAGQGANPAIGPNLTHMGSRWTIGAGVLANTPENMRTWLQNPQAVKPGTAMPNYHFSPQQVDALAAYMESLK